MAILEVGHLSWDIFSLVVSRVNYSWWFLMKAFVVTASGFIVAWDVGLNSETVPAILVHLATMEHDPSGNLV